VPGPALSVIASSFGWNFERGTTWPFLHHRDLLVSVTAGLPHLSLTAGPPLPGNILEFRYPWGLPWPVTFGKERNLCLRGLSSSQGIGATCCRVCFKVIVPSESSFLAFGWAAGLFLSQSTFEFFGYCLGTFLQSPKRHEPSLAKPPAIFGGRSNSKRAPRIPSSKLDSSHATSIAIRRPQCLTSV
jgi:hypothetical protein